MSTHNVIANTANPSLAEPPSLKAPVVIRLIASLETALGEVFRFTGSAERVIAHFFHAHPKLGSTERTYIAQGVFSALRHLIEWTYLARELEDQTVSLWVEPVGASAWAAFFEKTPTLLRRRIALQSLCHTLGYDTVHSALKTWDTDQADWLANTVLQGPTHLQAAFGAPEWMNFPSWLSQRLMEQLEQFALSKPTGSMLMDSALLNSELLHCIAGLQTSAPVDLRVNIARTDRRQMLDLLATQGIQATATPYAPAGIRIQGHPSLTKTSSGAAGVAFQKGWFEVQDEGSQLLAHLVAPKRGQTIVDFCAGAGGKTLALGALMRSTGRIYALDTDAKRLNQLEARRVRSGLSNVHALLIDSEHDPKLDRFIGPTGGKADRVLVDAPCSGLGTLRRQPDLKWRYTPTSITEYAALQRSILRSAARLVNVGGRLIYATCSFLESENAAIVNDFLSGQPTFRMVCARTILANQHIHLARPLTHDALSSPVSTEYNASTLQLWPHRDGTDAFFAAVLERI